MITEEETVDNWSETRLKSNLGRAMSSSSGGNVSSIHDFETSVLSETVDSVALHYVHDGLTSKLKISHD